MLTVHYIKEDMRRWCWCWFPFQSVAEYVPRTGGLPSLALCAVGAGVLWAQYTSRVWIPPPQTGSVTCPWGSCCSRRRETWHSFHSEVLQEYLFGLICLKEEEEVRKIQNSTGNLSHRNQMYVIISLSSTKSLPMDKDVYQLWILNPFYFLQQNHSSLSCL